MGMKDVKVENGIPRPESEFRRYPHDDMKVGDSFAVPLEGHARQNVYSANWRASKRLGYGFMTETRVEDEKMVVRTWRTS